MTQTTPVQDRYTRFSCPNPRCAWFKPPGEGNMGHRSWTGKHQPIERLRCTACRRACSEREGTLMARRQLSEDTGERLVKCQRWGVCDAGTAASCAVDLQPVYRFQPVATHRAKTPHRPVVQEVDGSGVQWDAAHAKLRPQQVAWVHTALAMGSGLLLGGDCGPRTQDTAAALIAQVVARTRQLPLFLTDRGQASTAALLQGVGGVDRPRRRGHVGRKPTPRRVGPKALCYAQVGKVRNQTGQVVEVRRRGVYGGPRRCVKQWRLRPLGKTMQTACMARGDGPLRGLVAPRRRRTRGRSWNRTRHRGQVGLLVRLDNFVLPHKSLGQGRPPAMALGLTAHGWSDRAYSWLPVHPDPALPKQIDERIAHLLTPALQDQPSDRPQAPAPPVESIEEKAKAAVSLPKGA